MFKERDHKQNELHKKNKLPKNPEKNRKKEVPGYDEKQPIKIPIKKI